jgi:cytoskeletal protein CcmA (bactofilin family)
MLRIGKNAKDQEDNDHHSSQRPEVPDYSTPKTYPSYQSTSAETKPAVEMTTSGASSRAMTESESLAKDIKEGTLSGFVGGGTVVTGEANFKAMMRIDGHMSGRVNSSSGTLIVGANGKVDANIEVAVAIIHGTINGNIQTPSLVIEQGAVFEGSCKMVQMTAAVDKAKKDKRDDQPLDTSRMKPIPTDAGAKSTDIPAATNVVN